MVIWKGRICYRMSRKAVRARAEGQQISYYLIKRFDGCRNRHTNLAMAWIDYKKAYDFIPIVG